MDTKNINIPLRRKWRNAQRCMCPGINRLVPSGTIKEVLPTGTIPCLGTVCFARRRNLNPRYCAKNADLHHQWMLETQPTPPSPPNGPGSPQCGDLALDGAVGRIEMIAHLTKTERGIDPINFNNTEM